MFALAMEVLRSAVRMMEHSSLPGLHLPLLLGTATQHLSTERVPLALARANLEIAMRMLVLTAD